MSPKITRAIISVSNKTGLNNFAWDLQNHGVEILSTGGTAKFIRELGIPVIDVSEYTGFPECFDGRVKTLHPRIHGGFLFEKEKREHVARAKELDIPPIDMVVVNLYPFEQTVAKSGVTFAEAIENIDIGGPAILRGAAKNHSSVAVICDPADYRLVAAEMHEFDGFIRSETCEQLALKAFGHTAEYDAAIVSWLKNQPLFKKIIV